MDLKNLPGGLLILRGVGVIVKQFDFLNGGGLLDNVKKIVIECVKPCSGGEPPLRPNLPSPGVVGFQ
jgi:hypothetical protein